MKFGHETRKILFYRAEFPTTWNLDLLESWLDRLNMPLNLDTDLKSKLCWPYYRNCWRVTTKHDQGTDWNLINSFIVDGTAYKFGPYVLSFYSRWILTNFYEESKSRTKACYTLTFGGGVRYCNLCRVDHWRIPPIGPTNACVGITRVGPGRQGGRSVWEKSE